MNYWETRLKQNYNLKGVGDQTLGLRYNDLLYKIRKIIFYKVLKQLNTAPNKSILEIGPGTGFYIEEYKKNNFKNVYGVDISDTATNELNKKYPDYNFICDDISQNTFELNKKFDIVFAFDVLFHIVDDSNYKNCFANIAKSINNNGYFVFTEYESPDTEFRLSHFVVRNKELIMRCLKSNNFEVIKKFPVFVMFNQPYSAKNGLFKKFISAHLTLIRKFQIYRALISYLLFPLELLLLKFERFSPSTIVWICKKND